ncbi:hypothetical protein PG993_005740 [Apiospora rasikravindrae]|uniref:HNH nuclease domain-containing protein n=1 Tax=Apiospora rasikravindrae TaxID=990691 RepID=A0ABR1TBG1_9PEZI
MNAAPIQSTFLAHKPLPPDELAALLDAIVSDPRVTGSEKRQAERMIEWRIDALEHMKRRLARSLAENHDDDDDDDDARVRALKTEANIRVLIALCECPEAEFLQVIFFADLAEEYHSDHEYPYDIFKNNRDILSYIGEIMRLWMSQYIAMFAERKRMSVTQWIRKMKDRKVATAAPQEGEEDDGGKAGRQESQSIPADPLDVMSGYGNQCLLTHNATPAVRAAVIVPNHATQKDEGYSLRASMLGTLAWRIYRRPVAAREIDMLSRDPDGSRNVIPLHSSLAALWDRSCLLLRPLAAENAAEEKEDRTLKLQLLLLDQDNDPALSESVYRYQEADPEDHGLEIAEDDMPHNLQTGDIYKLETSDPEKYPLPSRALLKLSCLVNRVLHACRARGALASLFRGPPPPDVDEEAVQTRQRQQQDRPNTTFWEVLVQDAVDAGVLSTEDGWRWVVALEALDREDDVERILRNRDRQDNMLVLLGYDEDEIEEITASRPEVGEVEEQIVGETWVCEQEMQVPCNLYPLTYDGSP